MYKPSGGESSPNARETTALPPENSTWHREPYNRDLRTDRADRDRAGAGKRHWNGERSSSMTSFPSVPGGAPLGGNGYVPRSKPRFQGHYSGFFAESGRNGPSFAATAPVDAGLARRYHRIPYSSGTSPAAKSQGYSGNPAVEYRASDSDERHTRDQFLPSADDKEGRDQPLPPHTPQVHSDAPLLRNGDRSRQPGSRVNWESSPRIDRDNITRPHSSADIYGSRRRSIVTQFDSGKDWVVGDKRSELGRFERYGTGNRDGSRADFDNGNKESGFSHGWRRERGSSGSIARHSSFTAGNRSLGDIGGRGSFSSGSAHDPLHLTSLSPNQEFDQPSPSKRPRLGWGQGLAKYEKKVGDIDDASPVDKADVKKDGQGEPCLTVEGVDMKRSVEHEKRPGLGWGHDYKREGGESLSDAQERLGENDEKTIEKREHGARDFSGQDISPSVFLDPLKRGGDNAKSSQELQGVEEISASPVGMGDHETAVRGGKGDKSGVALNDSDKVELNDRGPAPPILSDDSKSRGKEEVTTAVVRNLDLLEGKGHSPAPSLYVGEAERGHGEVVNTPALAAKSQDVLEGNIENITPAIESTISPKQDLSTSMTSIRAEQTREGSVTECKSGAVGVDGSLLSSPTTHLEMITEEIDVVSCIETSPVRSSTGFSNSSCSPVAEDSLANTAPPAIVDSNAQPAASVVPPHPSRGELPSTQQNDGQGVRDMSMDEKALVDAEGLGQNALSGVGHAPKGSLNEVECRQEPETSQVLGRGEETDLPDPEPVGATLQSEPMVAPSGVGSLDPSMSQVCEKVIVTIKSDPTLPESEPASEGLLVTKTDTTTTYDSVDLHVLDDAVPLDPASQIETSILETMERVEAEIDVLEKEIAQFKLKSSDIHQAQGTALDPPSKDADDEDVPTPMEEDTAESVPSTDTRALCPSFSQSSPTAVSTRLEKSSICSEKDSSTPMLCGRIEVEKEVYLLRNSSMTPMPENGVLDLVPGVVQSKSTKDMDVEDVRGVPSGSMSQSLGSEESEYLENLVGNEVAAGVGSLQERDRTMVESLMMENKEKARLSGVPLARLLPQNLTGENDQQLYHTPTEAPIWEKNVESHKVKEGRLLRKLSERHHFNKFKEHVLTLRYRALNEAWKREQKGLSDRRNRPKIIGRWDGEGRSGHGPPSQRPSSRLRPFSLDRLDAESDAAQAMKMLLKDPHVEALRPVLKMPAMILDEKEREVRKFVSRNALVEDPIAVQNERKILNPWTAEEKKIFSEKFAIHYKNFKEIASHIQFKTTADCVQYYYQNQKSEEFRKSQRGVQLKNRWDYTKTSSTFLTPTAAGIKRNQEADYARLEAMNAATMNVKLSQSSSRLQVLDHAHPTTITTNPLSIPSPVETPKLLAKENAALEVVLPSGATVETATSSFISTPCSVSSTVAPANDQCKEKESVKERVRSWPSTMLNTHSEQNPAGLKGARSTHLRRMPSRAAAQVQESQWTDGERELFTSAVATHGKDFRLIASHVGTKSQNQCKAFFSKTRKRLGLDELVEQFQANEAAAMLVQSFRHDADLAQEVKQISNVEDVQMDGSAGAIAEELIDTAAAVSTLESFKVQSRCLQNDMSDLSLVADAAAVMEEIKRVKPECATLDLFSNCKSMTSSQDLACELLKVNRSTISSTVLKNDDEEDSEATKSDDSYQMGTEADTDIVVDQAAAALVGMSEMISGLKRSKSEAKVDTKSSPVSVFCRSQSARLPTASPPLHAETEANLCLTSARTARQSKERVTATNLYRTATRDRPQDMQDVHTGRKGRETAAGEPKARREPTSWTQEEKEKFAVILQEHGKDWTLLQESLPSKSLTQIKTYFQNSKARSRLPASDKLLSVGRNDSGNRKRKADDYESTRRAAELALPVKQKVRSNAAPSELDSTPQKEDIQLGSPSVSGHTGVGADILAYAARFGTFPGQPVDQDTLSMNGMQHIARQRVPANSYSQGAHDAHQVFRPGARPVLPSPGVSRPHSSGGILQQLSGPGPSKAVGSDLQSLSPGAVQQAGPPAIHQVAQQVQQDQLSNQQFPEDDPEMLQQQQQLQKQLSLLIQHQQALPSNLLPQHQATLQAVRPLEEKLHQVVQHIQHQYEQAGRGQALSREGEIHSASIHFQQHATPARGILKVKPIRGAASKSLDLTSSTPSSAGVFNKVQIEDMGQDHSLSLGIGTIPTVTAGSTAGLQQEMIKTAVELQDSDTDTDCEGMGSRLMVTEDSHQRMSIVHSTSSGQQQGGAAQSTTSTLSSDSEQVKSRDVKLFGQSLLSKPPSLPSSSSLPRPGVQEFLNPNTSSTPTLTLPAKSAFRPSESLPSAFGRVPSSSALNAEGQLTTAAWPGKYGAWSAASSLQFSGVTDVTRREAPDSEFSAQETVTSIAPVLRLDRQHSDTANVLAIMAPQQQAADHDDKDDDSESGNLKTTPTPCDAAASEDPEAVQSVDPRALPSTENGKWG